MKGLARARVFQPKEKASDFSSLGLSFLICKMCVLIMPLIDSCED